MEAFFPLICSKRSEARRQEVACSALSVVFFYLRSN